MGDLAMVVGADAHARVYLADGANWISSKTCEFQPIQSWTNTQIVVTQNTGAISSGQRYFLVVDATNTQVASYQVTVP